MINKFTLNNVEIEVNIRISPCGPDIQDILIGGCSVLELFDGTELERRITDHVEDNYLTWVAEEDEELRIAAAERKREEHRERVLLGEYA